jgi:hypothetical protein
MATLNDIGTYLDAQLGSLTLGTNLFLGRLPTDPDKCVALLEYGGSTPVSTLGSDAMPRMELPRIQVLSRDVTYADARSLAISIWLVIEGILNETLSGTLYQRVSAVQSVFPLERDSAQRAVFAQNFQVFKEL